MDTGPGTIWETQATLSLAAGTWVQKVVSSPRRDVRQDPMHYLQKEVRGAKRHVARSYFRVNTRGILKRAPDDQAPPENTPED
jgi:hypothetical protein